ncbi:MAG: exonuclease domain-containing protein, partial [Chloroflexota bacterium]
MAQAATRYRHLAEMAIEFLETAGQPQPAQTLTTRLLGESAARQTAFVRLVEQLLDEDARFCRDAAGRWALAGWERGDLALPLAQQEFAVVDVETTGGRKERHRIVEVAVVKVRDGRITEHYESLVNPQRPLPQFITDLTGITQEMVECAPTADGVLLEARAFIGDLVLVGHNVACDLTFLNYEALWHGLPPFGNPALDTEELALRLLPDLRRPSLRRVAATLGLPQPVRHRAFADARLAAGILLELLRRLDGVAGTPIDTFGQLQDWLASRLVERQARVRRVRAVLPAGTLDALPEQPGVYTFRDAEGRALYVGKAASLRDRVAQHFSGTARALRREDGLLERTAAVEHEVAGCELDALLHESERIRTLQPPYNVQERSRRGCPFLRFEAGVFPRVAAAQQVTAETLYAGPYHTTQAVRHTIQTLRRVFQLR